MSLCYKEHCYQISFKHSNINISTCLNNTVHILNLTVQTVTQCSHTTGLLWIPGFSEWQCAQCMQLHYWMIPVVQRDMMSCWMG